MKNLFSIISMIAAILMVAAILMQTQGASLGTAFGGESSSYRSKRGAELFLYNATIVLGIIFVMALILSILAKS